MVQANLNNADLLELSSPEDHQQHCQVTFPLLGAHGTQHTATVYFELNPGDHVGRHQDSAEELLLIIEGKVKAEIDGETAEASAGTLLLVPAMAPHDVTNIGDHPAKVLGVFGGANHITTTFEQGWQPDGNTIVNTELLFQQT